MYKIRGKITNVVDEEINTAKGDFVKKLITVEEFDTGFNHVQQFEIFGKENIDVIENTRKLKEDQVVNIDFYIKSREYKGKFYNTLIIKQIMIEDAATTLSSESMPFENKTPF